MLAMKPSCIVNYPSASLEQKQCRPHIWTDITIWCSFQQTIHKIHGHSWSLLLCSFSHICLGKSVLHLRRAVGRRATFDLEQDEGPTLLPTASVQQWSNSQSYNCWQHVWWFSISLSSPKRASSENSQLCRFAIRSHPFAGRGSCATDFSENRDGPWTNQSCHISVDSNFQLSPCYLPPCPLLLPQIFIPRDVISEPLTKG